MSSGVADLSFVPFSKGVDADLAFVMLYLASRRSISRLTNRDSMLGIIASDADAEKASDFAFIDNFDFLCKFREDRIAG